MEVPYKPEDLRKMINISRGLIDNPGQVSETETREVHENTEIEALKEQLTNLEAAISEMRSAFSKRIGAINSELCSVSSNATYARSSASGLDKTRSQIETLMEEYQGLEGLKERICNLEDKLMRLEARPLKDKKQIAYDILTKGVRGAEAIKVWRKLTNGSPRSFYAIAKEIKEELKDKE